MSRIAPDISPSAVLIDYRTPIPLKIVLIIGTPMWMLPAFSALLETHQYNFAAVCLLLGGGLLLLLFINNRGYRVAWDGERVYMREWGFCNLLFMRKPFHAISYDEMTAMKGKTRRNPGAASRYMPFEYLEISAEHSDVSTIWIYPLSLNERDMREFLIYLLERRPDIFPVEIKKRIHRAAES